MISARTGREYHRGLLGPKLVEADGLEPVQDIDSLTFEDAFRRLDEVAASLEQGSLTLSEATDRYQQGMSLVRRCNQLLDEAQLKITNLKETYAAPDAGPDAPDDLFFSEGLSAGAVGDSLFESEDLDNTDLS